MNSKRSRIRKTLIILNSIFLIVIIIFTPLSYHIFNLNYYEHLYEKNGVYLVLNKDDVLKVTIRIFDFFKYREELKPMDYNTSVRLIDESESKAVNFEDNEVRHLKDVRELLLKIFILYCAAVLLFIVTTFFIIKLNSGTYLKDISMVFVISSGTVFFFILLLYLMGNNFPFLFDGFHRLFFPQGNYLFSSGSLIITIFPFGFFYDFFLRIILSSAVLSAIIIAAGIILMTVYRFKIYSTSRRRL
jgi:hypothetical protein